MEIVIDTSTSGSVNWKARGTERIVQNVVNLINTWQYEVAYDRTMGLPQSIIDQPLPQAIAAVTAEIFNLIASREPRAEVKSVDYIGIDSDGNMQFKVVINIE